MPKQHTHEIHKRDKKIPTQNSNSKKLILGICVFLMLAVLLVFGKTRGYEFVNYDDDHHVYANSAVTNGLTLNGISWAFHHNKSDYWHPLDFLSHMVDCQIYGLNPGGHHLTNVILHAAVAVLLFLVLLQLTGELWPSAFVAMLFAVHPLRVESVAWVSERKDMLHGFFFLLTIAAYVRYVRNPKSLARYSAVVFLFALGLMSKPTLMTLPFVLLLLDYWPLNRFGALVTHEKAPVVFMRLVAEKIPLMILSAASCIEAALGNSEAFESGHAISPFLAIANALVSYFNYIGQMFYPAGLAVLYPFPVAGIALWKLVLSLGLLLMFSLAAFRWRKRHPYVIVGWFWYLGMLLPMIGLMQAGSYARADRYTYLPQIGLYLLIAWGVKELSASWRYRPQILGCAACLMASSLMIGSWIQTSCWRDSESLWAHTLACTTMNAIAENNYGNALAARGRATEAISHYERAVEIRPDLVEAYNNLGAAHAAKGEVESAIQYYTKAIDKKPDYAEANKNIGSVYAALGHYDEAVAHLSRALATRPDYVDAHYDLGLVLTAQGRLAEAVVHYQKTIESRPGFAEAYNNLGAVYVKQGRYDEARSCFQQALQIKPDYGDAHFNLGLLFAGQNQAAAAAEQFQQVIQTQPESADAHYNLANVFAALGRDKEARLHYEEALRLNPKHEGASQRLQTF